jgi:hypothetical protein
MEKSEILFEEYCFFIGLLIRGTQVGAFSCESRLHFPSCKFCSIDPSMDGVGSGLHKEETMCECCLHGMQEENMFTCLVGE